jgi:hypothetical protein
MHVPISVLGTRLSALELLSKEATNDIRVAQQSRNLYLLWEPLEVKNQYNKKIGELRKALA